MEPKQIPFGEGVDDHWHETVIKLRAEIEDWRACAKYDVLMEGPKFMTWDRSALDRCRKKYCERV